MEPTGLAPNSDIEHDGLSGTEAWRSRRRWRVVPASSTVSIADHVVRLRRDGNHGVIDLSAGRASEATPAGVCEAAKRALDRGDTHQTPARGTADFNAAVATKLRSFNDFEVDQERHVLATQGCKNGLTLALMALLHAGDEVIVEDPCFVSYGPTIRLCGGVPTPLPLSPEEGFRWRVDQLLGRIGPRTKAIIICNPHNPTGAVADREYLQALADIACERDLFVISDEVYESMTWSGTRHVCIGSLPGMLDRSVTLMGFTKSHSMGGWRIGYAVSNPGVVETMVRVQQHLMTCASSIAQAGAIHAMSVRGMNEAAPMWRRWEGNVRRFADEINQIPRLSCPTPEGAFYAWVDVRQTGLSSTEFSDRLLNEAHVAVVPGNTFGEAGEGYVRVTCVKSADDMTEAAHRLAAFVDVNVAD